MMQLGINLSPINFMVHIPAEPVLPIVLGLTLITLMVLTLPFIFKRVEENLEAFFFIMGVLSVTVSGLWSWELVLEAARAPVMIGSVPVGIFQVVLIFGLILHFYNRIFCAGILNIARKIGWRPFVFLLTLVLGLLSSVVSVILSAVLLSEVIAALPVERKVKIKFIVVACFAVGLGAGLTPIGEPLSTVLVSKLSGPPYHADFFFLIHMLGIYIVPGVVALSLFGAFYTGTNISLPPASQESTYSETIKTVILRAVKVYVFIAALILLGEGLKPLIIWYFMQIPPWALYWINMISAVLDNATLVAIEVGPSMSYVQIISVVMGLLISGGMLIPGNIPNIVAAGRLKINMKEWALIGVPMGLVILIIYFMTLLPLFLSM